MKKTATLLKPRLEHQLEQLGIRLRLARERRKLGTELFAQRLGVSRETLRRLEKGDATISMATFLNALHVLGLDSGIDSLAAEDELGRQLQDAELPSQRKTAGA